MEINADGFGAWSILIMSLIGFFTVLKWLIMGLAEGFFD